MEAGAVSELQGIARFKFHEGKLKEYKRLNAQAMEIVRTKDTGTLFGPHGGALDRLDAVIFTVVAGYYIWVAVMH